MDWFRLQRALQARHVRSVEQTRDQLRRGKLTADKVDQETLAEVKRHDELYAIYYGQGHA